MCIRDRDEDVTMHLTKAQKEIFSYFVPIQGMEQQLCQVLTGVKRRPVSYTHLYDIHGRSEDYKELNPGNVAYYDGMIEINLLSLIHI